METVEMNTILEDMYRDLRNLLNDQYLASLDVTYRIRAAMNEIDQIIWRLEE